MGKKSVDKWLESGFEHVWLPYTQMKNAALPLPVKSASGSKIILEDGRELIDGIACWWSSAHGYSHPHIVEKMKEQVENLSHVMFAGFANKPAFQLCERIAKITPAGLNRVFLADSGSGAVEIAMKMAVQFWHNRGDKKRKKFIAFKNGYHGESMGALSLGDPEGWTMKAFNHYAPQQFFIDIPVDEYGFAEFDELLGGIKKETAGLIIEPLVQGAGGMKFHSADVLAEIYRICKKHEILFIADEIMTGFYRTGNAFACDEAGITPDIMCLGKALTGGMVSLAAAVTTDEIYNEFLSDNFDKAFLHGPTFMGNALACAAANASLDLFEKENYAEKVSKIEEFLIHELEHFKGDNKIVDVRVKGAIGVIQLREKNYDDMWKYIAVLRKKFIERGVFLRPFKDIIYILPNFNMTIDDLEIIGDSISDVLVD